MSPELALFQYFTEAIAAATEEDDGDVLIGADLHETVYQPIDSLKGIRIGDASGDIGPKNGVYKEFNVVVPIQLFRRVADNSNFKEAREELRELMIKAVGLIIDSPGLGSPARVCDAQVLLDPKPRRGWARIQTTPFAAGVFYVVVDQHGFRG